jgi:hypothetical protein
MSDQIEDGGPAFPEHAGGMFGEHVTRTRGMTLRQYAAIHLRVPQSGLPWLDEMIDQARWDAFAGQALAGLIAACKTAETPERLALGAHAVAAAMIEAGRPK